MVSDNRERTTFRLCPDTVGGAAERPLFQQHISLPTCQSRQSRQYHKCHRCVHAELAFVRPEKFRISMS